MSSTHQWRTSLVSNVMLIVGALAAALALAPAVSVAHPGHDHGLSSATGRLPGVPDYQKIKGVVSRFDAQSREYIVQKPGKPPMRAHIEADTHPGAEGAAANGGYSPLPSGESQPVCATTGHRFVVVRAYDEGTKTADTEDAHIRSLVKRMNWKFMQQSQLSSQVERTLQMRVDCDGSGTINVKDVAVPFGYLAEGIDTTDGDIGVLDTINYVELTLGAPEGPNAVKYLILNDKKRSGFVGIGYRYLDAVKNSSNLNVIYTTSSLIARNPNHTLDGKDSWESTIPIHEALHTMNAATNFEVEPGKWVAAPYASTNSHCVDGIDILCYADLGTSPEGLSYSEGRCPAYAGHESAERVTIDCKFDTYFDSETESGEWLSQWWNVGGSENPFLAYTPGVPPVATVPAAFTSPADFETYSATLKGIVNPGGVSTTYKFEYGTTTSYGTSIPVSPKSIGSGISDVEVSETISTEPEVTYHYRIVATNSKGTFYGEDKTVKTSVWGIQTIQGPSGSGGRGELLDVSCSSSVHCVAVGSNSKGATLAERWNGSQWSIMTTVNPAGANRLGGVSCSSSSFCMAVGAEGSPIFSEYWDGSSWSLVSMPMPSEAKSAAMTDVFCTSPTTCIAVGRYSGSKGPAIESKTLIERWNGSQWTIESSPNVEGNSHNQLSAISCTSSTSCQTVGYTTTKAGNPLAPLVEGWDGSKWSIQVAPTPPGGSGSLRSISCPVAGFCIASGAGGGTTFTAAWNGTSWQIQASGLPSDLSAISCATQSSCELIGNATGRHWSGSEWMIQDPSLPVGGTQVKLFSISCPQPSLCTAVGVYSGQPFFSPGERPLAERLTPTPHVKLRAEEYSSTSVTAVQSGEHNFKEETSGYNLYCKVATATGTVKEASSTLTLTPAYSNCTLFGQNATAKINSCQYVFYSTSKNSPFTGNMEIVCSKAGDSIEFSSAVCTLKLSAQAALGAVNFTNTGKKSRGRTITTTLSLTGIKYTEAGVACRAPGTHSAGTYKGTYVISGYNPVEEHPIGVYLANEQVVVPPLIESEKYSTVINGTLSKEKMMAIGMPGVSGPPISFTCKSTGTGEGLLTSASIEHSLKFKKWTGCIWFSEFTVSMNGCSFALHPLVGELPYTSGVLDIVCPKEKEITFTVLSGSCKVGIPAQSSLSSVKTENVGTGTTRAVEVGLVVKGLKYTQTGSQCTNSGTHKDGSLSGSWNLKGYEFFGEQAVEGDVEYLEGSQKGIWVE